MCGSKEGPRRSRKVSERDEEGETEVEEGKPGSEVAYQQLLSRSGGKLGVPR